MADSGQLLLHAAGGEDHEEADEVHEVRTLAS